jgi:hypothetical protein
MMHAFMRAKGEVNESVREYLARIGARGGAASRRELSKEQARMMVSIREALRTARKQGRTLTSRERKRLTMPGKAKPSPTSAPRMRPRTLSALKHDRW